MFAASSAEEKPCLPTPPITHITVPAPVTVSPADSIATIRKALATERFHHLPVISDAKLVGIISNNDLLQLGLGDIMGDIGDAKPAADGRLTAADIMQSEITYIGYRATVAEAAQKLSAGNFHALPVVDKHMGLMGLITSTDLIDHLLSSGPAPTAPTEILERMKLLENVLNAANRYLHSGLDVSEHARLQKAIDRAG